MDVDAANRMLNVRSQTPPVDDKKLEEWLSRIDMVKDTVEGLKDGTTTLAEADKVHQKINRKALKKQRKAEEQRREKRLAKEKEEKTWEEGRPGKGTAQDYEKFCRACMLEFKEDKKVCPQCNKDLICREERQQDLCDKVNVLLEEQHKRRWRRQRYQQWNANKSKQKAAGTDYSTWDYWEPDSDTDEDPICPDTPEFKAMEQDMKKRSAIRKEAARKSQICKEQGNNAVKFKHYKDAIGFYGQAIDHRKDDKFLYTNRALIHLYLGKYKSAEKDCNTALDIWEYLEDGFTKLRSDVHRKFATKAFLRRCAALRGQKKFDKAMEDVDQILAFHSDNKEALQMKAQVTRDIEDAEKAKEILATGPTEVDTTNLTTGTPFERITASLTTLRNFNTDVAATIEAIEDYKLLEPEECEGKEAPAEPTIGAELAVALTSLQSLLKCTNQQDSNAKELIEKHNIYLREKKGVVTLIKILKTSLTLAQRGCQEAVATAGGGAQVLLETTDNEHSKEAFVRAHGITAILKLLSVLKKEQVDPIAIPVLQLLSFTVEHPAAQAIIHRDFQDIWDIIVKFGVQVAKTAPELELVGGVEFPGYVQALTLLTNCTFDPRFRKCLREAKPRPLETLRPLLEQKEMHVSSRVWGAMANMLGDRSFRREFVNETDNLKFVCSALRDNIQWYRTSFNDAPVVRTDTFKKMLALALNCAVETDDLSTLLFDSSSKAVIADLTFLVLNAKVPALLRERCGGLLSRASKIPEHRADIIKAGGCEAFLSVLSSSSQKKLEASLIQDNNYDDVECKMMSESAHEHAARALAVLTNGNAKACEKVYKFSRKGKNKTSGIKLMLQCLSSKNAQVAGNSSLIVAHICGFIPESLDTFRDAIPLLINLMKIEKPASLGKNAAIATARLARHPMNIDIVRRLKGIELMYAVGQRK